jgi:hypothetical protein
VRPCLGILRLIFELVVVVEFLPGGDGAQGVDDDADGAAHGDDLGVAVGVARVVDVPRVRGLHSSTFQLNFSRS